MTVEKLVIVAAAILSFLFNYFPALAKWYEKHDAVAKRQIMAAWLLIVTSSIFAISCVPTLVDLATRFDIAVACSVKSAYELIYLYLLAIMANQTVWLLSPKARVDMASGLHRVMLAGDTSNRDE
jgi:hypothetical protein